MNLPCLFKCPFWSFLTKLKLQLNGNSVQLTTGCLHDYVTQRLISSRDHPNGIFASARGSRVLMVMDKMLCTTVLISEPLNVRIMLNILIINNASCCLAYHTHRDVVLKFKHCKRQKYPQTESKCTITTLSTLPF